jgi:hypothetical protein
VVVIKGDLKTLIDELAAQLFQIQEIPQTHHVPFMKQSHFYLGSELNWMQIV